MNWTQLTSLSELETAITSSDEIPVMFFKHSTRCSISSNALARLERKWEIETEGKVKPFLVDLIRYRPVSNAIAELTSIEHESPQVIVLHKGQVLYHATHNGIVYADIKDSLINEN